MAKVKELSPMAVEALKVLIEADAPMTLADLKEVLPTLNSSHLTALANRELVDSVKVEKEVVTVSKRMVNLYSAKPVVTE